VTDNTLMLRSSPERTRPAGRPIRMLVTGFGQFPGVRRNPAAVLVQALQKYKRRLMRLDIELNLDILPVTYAEIAPRLKALAAKVRPDACLHLGLAARRKVLSVETRALNRISPLRRDACKAAPARFRISPGGPEVLRSTFPAPAIAAALTAAGLPARLSGNAGNYVCNQTLYLSLALNPAVPIGFIHVPRPARRKRCSGQNCQARDPRLTLEAMERAVLIAILVTATYVRRRIVRAALPQKAGLSLDPRTPLA
jgi:pyroglutamyl-peptidase